MHGAVDHCWLKTDTREAGLGNMNEGQPSGQAVPGDQCDSPYKSQTQVVDHTGQSKKRRGTKCEEITHVDEKCVDDALYTDSRGYGTTEGAFTAFNNCQSWVNGVFRKCKRKCPKQYPSPPGDDGRRYF